MVKHPAKDTVFDAKRMLGRRYDDPSLAGFKSKWPFAIHESMEHTIKLQVPDLDGQQRLLPPEEVSCMVLEALLEAVQQQLGVRPVEAIITVPAYFREPQRMATRDAAEMAGLTVRRLINEPTAAAIAYGLEDPKQERRTVLVFDLGGGTFDISLLRMEGRNITTLATAGNDQLGGNDFDQRVLEWLIEELLKDFPGTPVGGDTLVRMRIRARIELAKIAVNKAHGRAEKMILVPDAVGTRDFRRVLTTEKFNELNEDLFQLCFRGGPDGRGGLDELFGKNGVGGRFNKDHVDEILTVGGSTNIPRIRELLQKYFQGKQLNLSMSADEAVARGAAALTAVLDSGAYEEVYQGKHEERAADELNELIGELKLTGVKQPGKGRMPTLRIMMQLDENSLLKVKAEDITTGSEARPVSAQFTVRKGRVPQEELDNIAADHFAERVEKYNLVVPR
jgi:molecular chaperone DnaK (HSP70)